MSIGDIEGVVVNEQITLSKFDGEALPENEVERVHIENGEVYKWERIENGEVVEEKLDEDAKQHLAKEVE